MAEYIERTEELMLAMNAGARAIENTKRYHGAVYTKDVFSDNSQEIPYLLAAKVLREVSDAPPADVAPVVRCKDCKHFNFEHMECENEAVSTDHEGGASYSLNFYLDDFCSYGERKEVQNGKSKLD